MLGLVSTSSVAVVPESTTATTDNNAPGILKFPCLELLGATSDAIEAISEVQP